MKKLRDQLTALQSIPSETEKAKESKVEMTKKAMKSFITTSLDMGVEAPTVHKALENLHAKDTDIVIDGDIYQWCVVEIEKQNTIRNPESSYPEEATETQPLIEVNFSEIIVQNSLISCHLLDCSDLRSDYPNSLCEVNKSEFLYLEGKEASSPPKDELLRDSCSILDEETDFSAVNPTETDAWPLLSQKAIHGTPVHQYLIAKGVTNPDNHVIYYMAFSSHQSLKEWNYGHMSFEDGMPLPVMPSFFP